MKYTKRNVRKVLVVAGALVVLASLIAVVAWLLRGRARRKDGLATPRVPGTPPAGAIVAVNLSDFATVDDSLVFPRGAGPEIVNITQLAPATFKFVLRHRGSWYDGDRDLKWNDDGHDKSRAEVSRLGGKNGPTMKPGETWDIGTTVWLDPSFVPSAGYCNIMQPVWDQSYLNLTAVNGNDVTARLMVFTNGIGSNNKVAREFTIRRGMWTSIVVRIKFATNGYYKCSVNWDPFQGVNMDTTKGSQPFRAKWGLYSTGLRDINDRTLGDSIVQHRNIYMYKVPANIAG